jgi:hypothetical protein
VVEAGAVAAVTEVVTAAEIAAATTAAIVGKTLI